MSFSPAGGANNAPLNSLAGFEGPIRGGGIEIKKERRGKGK